MEFQNQFNEKPDPSHELILFYTYLNELNKFPGDIFDEGSFSPDEVYLSYVERFYQLFNTTKKTELFVVAGNHDIGFHYA